MHVEIFLTLNHDQRKKKNEPSYIKQQLIFNAPNTLKNYY